MGLLGQRELVSLLDAGGGSLGPLVKNYSICSRAISALMRIVFGVSAGGGMDGFWEWGDVGTVVWVWWIGTLVWHLSTASPERD